MLFDASESCKSFRLKEQFTIELSMYSEMTKAQFRRRASTVLLSNLIPEFSSARQKHDVWTGP